MRHTSTCSRKMHTQGLSLARSRVAISLSNPGTYRRPSTLTCAAVASPAAPPVDNVADARRWISAWRARQAPPPVAAATTPSTDLRIPVLLTDEQLRAAIAVQLRKSMEAAQRRQAEQGETVVEKDHSELAREAAEEAGVIVDAFNAAPEQDPVTVLRELASRVPLLSDEQLMAGIQLQLRRSATLADGSGTAAPAATPPPPPAAATAAAPPSSPVAPCKEFSDGTLLFSSERLTSVNYSDINLAH